MIATSVSLPAAEISVFRKAYSGYLYTCVMRTLSSIFSLLFKITPDPSVIFD